MSKVETLTRIEEKNATTGFKMSSISLEDRQKLVGAFAWLIQEDKKQNPELYQPKKMK